VCVLNLPEDVLSGACTTEPDVTNRRMALLSSIEGTMVSENLALDRQEEGMRQSLRQFDAFRSPAVQRGLVMLSRMPH
jgi:hypothetical protein